jgi:hypothetical protein
VALNDDGVLTEYRPDGTSNPLPLNGSAYAKAV